MEPIRIAIIINPHSGKHDPVSRMLAKQCEPMVREILRGRAAAVAYVTNTLDELAAAVRDAVRNFRATHFVAAGGDGSTHKYLSALVPTCLKLGEDFPTTIILPTGTMNVAPNALGLTHADRAVAFERTLTLLRHGTPHVIQAHALRVNETYGFLYGAGLPVNALERYNAYEKRGLLRAAHVFGQILADEAREAVGFASDRASIADPFVAHFESIGERGHHVHVSKACTAILAGTIESIGLGSKPIYRARERGSHFHLISTQHRFWRFARKIPAIVRGTSLKGELDDLVRRTTVYYDRPLTRFVDGDMHEPAQCDELECGPLLSFLAP